MNFESEVIDEGDRGVREGGRSASKKEHSPGEPEKWAGNEMEEKIKDPTYVERNTHTAF